MSGFSDNEDRMVALLEQIVSNTGGLDELDAGVEQSVTIKGQSVKSRVGTIKPRNLLIVETDDLEDANADGSVTLNPGEQKTLVSYRGDPFAVLAAGAKDAADVTYQLRVDQNKPVGGTTNSPLGSVNDPFSFPDKLGGAPAAEGRVDYIAHLDSSASGPVDLVGRLYVEGLTP